MQILDIDFPECEDIRQIAAERGVDFGILSDAGNAVNVIGDAPLASAIVPAIAAAYIKGHANDLFTGADKSIREYQESWDESTLKDWVLLRASNGLLKLIDPFVDEDLESLARTDSDEFIRVLETVVQEESKSRDSSLTQIEKQLQQVFIGGTNDIDNIQPEEIVEDLREIFDVETDDEAVRLYILYNDLLKDLVSVCDKEVEYSNQINMIEKTKDQLLSTIAQIQLKNQNFEQLTIGYFDSSQPFQNKHPIHSWVYDFTFAEIAARTEEGDSYYFKHHLGDDFEAEMSNSDINNIYESHSNSWGTTPSSKSSLPTITKSEKDTDEVAKKTFQSFSDYIINKLQNDENVIITGPPGMGKSLICKRISFRWYNNQSGTVYYRSSSPEEPFEDRAELSYAIESAQSHSGGHVLVVVEDATRDESKEIFEVMEEYRERSNVDVSFLLDSRDSEWESFLNNHRKYPWLRNIEIGHLNPVSVPKINIDTVIDAVATYNSITSDKIPMNESKRIYKEITGLESVPDRPNKFIGGTLDKQISGRDDKKSRQNNHIGDMLVLTDAILSRSELDMLSSLLREAGETHDRLLEKVDYGGEDAPLRYQIAVLINVLNSSGIPIRRAYLYALADDRKDCIDIDRILSKDNLINGGMINSNESDVVIEDRRHGRWSVAFLLYIIESEDISHLQVFKNTFHYVLSRIGGLADNQDRLKMIKNHIASNVGTKLKIEEIIPDSKESIKQALIGIYRFGRRQPILFDIYTAPDLGTEVTDSEQFPESYREYTRFKILQIRASIAKRACENHQKYDIEDAKKAFEDLIFTEVPDATSAQKEYKIVTQVASRDYANFTHRVREYQEATRAYYEFIRLSKDLGHYVGAQYFVSFTKNALRCKNLAMSVDISEIENYLNDRVDDGPQIDNYLSIKLFGDFKYLLGDEKNSLRNYRECIDKLSNNKLVAETHVIISEILIEDIENINDKKISEVVEHMEHAYDAYSAVPQLGAAVIVSSHLAKIHAMNRDINKTVNANDLAITNFFDIIDEMINQLPKKIRTNRSNDALKPRLNKYSRDNRGDVLDSINLLLALEQHQRVYQKYSLVPEELGV